LIDLSQFKAMLDEQAARFNANFKLVEDRLEAKIEILERDNRTLKEEARKADVKITHLVKTLQEVSGAVSFVL
jgi:phosphate uptake regulator